MKMYFTRWIHLCYVLIIYEKYICIYNATIASEKYFLCVCEHPRNIRIRLHFILSSLRSQQTRNVYSNKIVMIVVTHTHTHNILLMAMTAVFCIVYILFHSYMENIFVAVYNNKILLYTIEFIHQMSAFSFVLISHNFFILFILYIPLINPQFLRSAPELTRKKKPYAISAQLISFDLPTARSRTILIIEFY